MRPVRQGEQLHLCDDFMELSSAYYRTHLLQVWGFSENLNTCANSTATVLGHCPLSKKAP